MNKFLIDYNDSSSVIEINETTKLEMIHFYYEGVYSNLANEEQLQSFFVNICSFHYKNLMNNNYDNSFFLFKLGYLYENCYCVYKDYSKAKEYYELSAEKNNADAINSLGIIYYKGLGVDQDIIKAKEYFELSAKLNNSDALYNLGDLLYDQDFMIAKEYFELSAKLNNSDALCRLGSEYDELDDSKAIEYYETAAKFNSIEAITSLASFYSELGDEKSEQLYRLSKKISLEFLKQNFGINVNLDDLEIEDPFDYIFIFFESIKDKYYNRAISHLADFYYDGEILPKNIFKAVKYYKLAARIGDYKSQIKLGSLYFTGELTQDFLKAIKYFEMASKERIPFAFMKLGEIYFYGYGVERNFLKAREYYLSLANLKLSFSDIFKAYGSSDDIINKNDVFVKLGNIFENGYDVAKDYLRAKEYYQLAADSGNEYAMISLGNLYENGLGVEKNYLIAKSYYENAALYHLPLAYICLGMLYENGRGVQKNYLMAKKMYQKSIECDNYYYHNKDNATHIALLLLGNVYENPDFVQHNYLISFQYYLLSAKEKQIYAFYRLGTFFSIGDIFEVDINKAINYFLDCINIFKERNTVFNPLEMSIFMRFDYYKYYYISCNDLGLIYIIYNQNIDEATKFMKESAFSEYNYGQNNYGLLNELYFENQIGNAEYMYKKASNQNFALSEYNLGHMREKENKIEDSIAYFIRASNHENEPLIFQKKRIYDKRLEISRTFIICLTNLKLTDYYLLKTQYNEARDYFVKVFNNIILDTYKFQFIFNENDTNPFDYLKQFILKYPLFNLENQPNLNLNSINTIKEKDKIKKAKENKIIYALCNNLNKKNKLFSISKQFDLSMKNETADDFETMNDKFFENTGELFDFVILNEETLAIFIEQIEDIIKTMETILYTSPYLILFGRICIEKSKPKSKIIDHPLLKDINEEFYNGLGLNDFKKIHAPT